MLTGVVRWYDPEKGFGFIRRDDDGTDLFVHRSAIGYEQLREGDRVEFDLEVGLKGDCAAGVRVLERGPALDRPFSSRPRQVAVNGGIRESRKAVDPSTLPLVSGKVRRFDPSKGFGFISQLDPTQPDVFFHQSVVAGRVVEGDYVEFRLGSSLKGPRAEAVSPQGTDRSKPASDW